MKQVKRIYDTAHWFNVYIPEEHEEEPESEMVDLILPEKTLKPSNDPTHRYRCPISHLIFRNPVVAEDGFTYERKAITEWMEKKETSPMTIC